MEPIKTLFDCVQVGDLALPPALHDLYGGNLDFPKAPSRPYVVANFVSTLDGVASYKIPGHSGGSEISGSDEADRFIMGLLRASADAIMIGSQTIREASPDSLWIPAFTYPEAEELFTRFRADVLGKPEHPLVVILSGNGLLDLERAVFRTPEAHVLIVTTDKGERELTHAGAARRPWLHVRAMNAANGSIDPRRILDLLRGEFGVRLLLHEGGPATLGKFAALKIVDELFLTLASQIAGRVPGTIRPGIIEGVEFLPGLGPWFHLLSVKQHADHLYLRYRLRPGPNGSVPPEKWAL